MKELKGTKTEKNLWEAFAGESQARNKYTYFASKAKKDGYVQIANIFEETALRLMSSIPRSWSSMSSELNAWHSLIFRAAKRSWYPLISMLTNIMAAGLIIFVHGMFST